MFIAFLSLNDGRTENRTPISHLAKAGATKIEEKEMHKHFLMKLVIYYQVQLSPFHSPRKIAT